MKRFINYVKSQDNSTLKDILYPRAGVEAIFPPKILGDIFEAVIGVDIYAL